MKEHLQAIVTVLSLINPVVCGAMFARVEAGRPRAQQVTDATRAALAILAILVLAALAGTRLLDLFNVSLDAFMVAGGGVLAWMGFSMLSGQSSQSQDAPAASQKDSLTPLILFAASPGTITGVITLAAAHSWHECAMRYYFVGKRKVNSERSCQSAPVVLGLTTLS
jgi:multiple antibiotic resistance protein